MTPAVVIGSGRTVWDDLRAVAGPSCVFAVNDMVVYAPRVDHAVSHHPDKLAHWLALRKRVTGAPPITSHSSCAGPVDRVWPEFHAGGSSSLLAVRIALALGCPSVVVAGVPLDASGYVWSDPAVKSYDFARYRKDWIASATNLRGRVTSPSGFLCELLGAPDGRSTAAA